MGCSCNKPRPRPSSGSGRSQSFALIVDGQTQTFGSRLEAEAEWVRTGRRGKIEPK